jgi:hypothetical protein
MSKAGFDSRPRNRDGEISGKHGNTLIRTLRKVYGQSFAAGYPETEKLHCSAHDPAAVGVQDGGQIEPSLIGLDTGDVGEQDPVRRSGGEVSVEQIRGDWEIVTAVGGPHSAWPRLNGPERLIVDSACDWGVLDPLAVAKTARLMAQRGIRRRSHPSGGL